ncbi:hypothetical protein [Clostridium sp. AWRP]|uniref:hypothetical protein n=1 Tax=Clostridium sp. AWRP TaxID=2212991 RepID=UPI000FD7D253|nr:hypothetical protein [Clostridium sp. AWRP]AZV56085.1 hypothetical protein DMR38_05435 [Clostridium sp. AWRP]
MAGYTTYSGLSNVALQNPLTKVLPDSGYAAKAQSQYDPSYNLKVTGLQNTLANNLSNLENSKGQIVANYDKSVASQNLNNELSKNNLNNDALNRGLGRSSIVTSGLAQADVINNRALAGIQGDKTTALNNVALQQANANMDEQNQQNTMAANRLDDLQALADKLKDKDLDRYDSELANNRNYYMQQLNYNNAVGQLNDNNYWKGVDQGNWQQQFNLNKSNSQFNNDLNLKKYNLDASNSAFANNLNEKNYNTSQGAVNAKISNAATDVYSRIYGQFNNSKDALSYLQSNKARVIGQMTQAGMTPNDAMNYYIAMSKDLGSKQYSKK